MNVQEERMWGMLTHLSALFAIVFPPIGMVIGPLIVWLIKRESSYYINNHGKEALNFNISFLIYLAASFLLIIVLIGFVLAIVVSILWLVFLIIAAVKANNGEPYTYPLTIRFIK